MYKITLLFFIVVSLSFFKINSKEPSMITVPIKILENSYEKYPIFRETKISIERQVEVETPLGPKIRKLTEDIYGTIQLLGCQLFAAPISIGAMKNQDFNVVLDTGSINLWVPKVDSNDAHKIVNHFDPSIGGTATKTNEKFTVQYGTGSTEGYYYSDKINFISLGFYEMKFGVAYKTDFDVNGADGIMGLAKKYNSDDYSAIFTLNSKGKLKNKSFSFKYIKDDMVEMYLGNEHEDFSKNNTAQCQLLHKTTYDNLLWTCKLYNFGFISDDNSKNATAPCGYNFLFDTGSNIMILPLETIDYLSEQLYQFGCNRVTTDNGQQILCDVKKNLLPNVYIEIGNHYLILDHNQVFSEVIMSGKKTGYILDAVFKDTNMPLIGQRFFKLFHTKFDPENKVLKFYNDDIDKIRFSYDKPNDDSARTFGYDNDPFGLLSGDPLAIIAIVLAILIVLMALCCVFRCCKRMLCSKPQPKAKSSIEMKSY
jgi:hypothetical protein